MLSAIKERLDREEEGFTLIELMVVVLIIAILLAIAIPTFLGARNSANARATQSNLRNALTAEQTEWTNTQGFNTNLATIEPALKWATAEPTTEGGNSVFVTVNSADNPQIALQGYAKDGNCYLIFQSSHDPTLDYTGHQAAVGTRQLPTFPTAAPTAPGNGAITGGPYTSW